MNAATITAIATGGVALIGAIISLIKVIKTNSAVNAHVASTAPHSPAGGSASASGPPAGSTSLHDRYLNTGNKPSLATRMVPIGHQRNAEADMNAADHLASPVPPLHYSTLGENSIRTGDDLLSKLAEISPENRVTWLKLFPVRLLREAADLCGESDTEFMCKKSAILAIVTNF